MTETTSHIQHIAFHLDGMNTVLFILLAALAFAAALWYYRTTVPPVTGWQKRTLTTLRFLALLALVVAFAKPVIHVVESVETAEKAAVLIDSSTSIAFPADPARERDVRDVFRHLQNELGDSAVFYGFDRDSGVLKDNILRFDGHGTDITSAIRNTLKNNDISSVIVVSDGRWNLGEDPVSLKSDRDIPVHAVFAGTVSGVSEFAVERISAPSVVYENETYTLDAMITSYAPTDETIRVNLTENGRVIDNIDLSFGGGTRAQARFTVPATNPGTHSQIVSIVSEHDEIQENNSRPFTLDVLKSTFSILIVAGEPSPDLAFLTRTANADQALDVEILVNNGTIPTPQPKKSLDQYDAFVILDGGGRTLGDDPAAHILNRVANGAGLWILGSEFSGTGAAVIEPALPVTFNPNGDIIAEWFQSATPDGGRHFVTAGILSPGDNRRLEALPPLPRILPVIEVRESGRILARASSTEKEDNPLPSIIAGRHSAGKVLVTPMSGLWRWRLMAAGSGTGNETFYTSFVHGSLRWLTAYGDASPLTISVDGGSFLTGQEITLEARLIDRIFMPVAGADISAIIDGDDRMKLFFEEYSPAIYTTSLNGLSAGNHTYTATARIGGVTIAEHKGTFTIDQSSVENIDMSPAPNVMAALAQRNDGVSVTVAGIDSLLENLTFSSHLDRREHDHQPASGPFWAFCAIILLLTEWTIRKIRGLL